jgi:hypothetical protein
MQYFRLVAVAASVLVTGCYVLQPVTSTGPVPQVGTNLALDVNDVGRVALGGSIGPEIGQIQGRLLSQENGEYVVAVSLVRFLRGGEQTWTGEQVRIKKEYVGTTYERRLHKGRTIALSTAIAGGLLAVAVSQDLFGLGHAADPIVPPDTGITFRPRRP